MSRAKTYIGKFWLMYNRTMSKKLLIALGLILLVAALGGGALKFRDIFTEKPTETTQETLTEPVPEEEPVVELTGFDKTRYSTTEPASPWWVVNKTRPLPSGYVPADLVLPDVRRRLSGEQQMQFSNQAVPDLKEMFAAATADGVTLVFGSGYRSEALQRQFYNNYVSTDGQESADRLSARPGTSEHQTGLSFDATSVSQKCHLETCFEETPEGTWLRENSYKYGFIIRYIRGKESVTGYDYEPWHMRWVGKELAAEMHITGITTLEEFFDLPAAPDYL